MQHGEGSAHWSGRQLSGEQENHNSSLPAGVGEAEGALPSSIDHPPSSTGPSGPPSVSFSQPPRGSVGQCFVPCMNHTWDFGPTPPPMHLAARAFAAFCSPPPPLVPPSSVSHTHSVWPMHGATYAAASMPSTSQHQSDELYRVPTMPFRVPSPAPHLPHPHMPPSEARQPSASPPTRPEPEAVPGVADTGHEGVTRTNKKRSAIDALQIAQKHLRCVPEGFPEGPIVGDRNALKEAVLKYTSNVETGGGAFGVVLAAEARAAKSRGDVQRLKCREWRKSGCKYSISYEDTEQGWVLVRYGDASGSCEHSHPLATSATQSMAQNLGKCIPSELVGIAQGMAKTCRIAAIDKVLIANAISLGLPITWDYDFLRNHLLPSSSSNQGFCLHNIIEDLESRKSEKGLRYFVRTDEMEYMDRLFIELAGGFETWAEGGENNVLLFDPTWGTNKQGYKLCCFTTIGGTGSTEIVAVAILARETEEMFEWAFRCFASVFKESPSNIFTDSDDRIAKAVNMMKASNVAETHGSDSPPWHRAQHRLCVYHLSQNFFTHIKPVFGADICGWRAAMNMFWSIAKNTDSRCRETFSTTWAVLLDYVQSRCTNSPGLQRALDWLHALGKRKEQFCARFVWGSCTWGIHSTQRAESIHSSIKQHITCKMHIWEVIQKLDTFNEVSRDRRLVDQEVLHMKQSQSVGNSAFVDFLQGKITPFAMKLVMQQQAESLSYNCVDVSDSYECHTWEVTRRAGTLTRKMSQPKTTAEGSLVWNFESPEDYGLASDENATTKNRLTTFKKCSCQFSTAFGGLPCRHILALHTINQSQENKFAEHLQSIADKWIVKAPEAKREAVSKLRTAPDPIALTVTTFGTGQALTRKERFKILSQHCEALSDVAVTSNEAFDTAVETIKGLTKKLLHPQRTSASPRASHCAAVPLEAENAGAGAGAGSAFENASATDEASLRSILGVTTTPLPPPTDDDFNSDAWWRDLYRSHIAIKFENKRSGGWEAGIICAIGLSSDETLASDSEEGVEPLQEGQVRIYFLSDHTEVTMSLTLKYYTTHATAPKCSWMLLAERPLGVPADATVHHPRVQVQKGRPQSRRRTAAAGPLGPRPQRAR